MLSGFTARGKSKRSVLSESVIEYIGEEEEVKARKKVSSFTVAGRGAGGQVERKWVGGYSN